MTRGKRGARGRQTAPQGYRPVPLGKSCNVGADFLGLDAGWAPIGAQQFHGLPFLIGSARPRADRCLIGFSGKPGDQRVTVSIRRPARWVIVAHVQLESRVLEGEPIGHLVANYRLALAGGREYVVPIRERFEIAVVPLTWGMLPFEAVADGREALRARHRGPWDHVGYRQTEATNPWPRAYYLWAWMNPEPDRAVESLTIEPADRKFAVAAVTTSDLAEFPFCRTARQEVMIELSAKLAGQLDKPIDVEVDRGVTTYCYPLPDQTLEQYLADPLAGWGQPRVTNPRRHYAHVAANPSATLTVKDGDQQLAQVPWEKVAGGKTVRDAGVSVKLIDTGRNWVHTRVIDDATGRPVPCRIHFRSHHMVPYQPHGHPDHLFSDKETWHIDIGGDLRLGQTSYAYIDGTCQGWLPRGRVLVDVARGYEYAPLRQVVEIQPGQRELELRLKRIADPSARGWYSGDTHVHFLGERGAHTEAAAEGLNVVNLLASQWGHLFTNAEDFIGRPTTGSDGKTIVYCSQENRQHLLGHLTLLGLKEQVSPWCSDGPSEAEMGGNLETTMARWADACHAQGGTVVIPHFPVPNGEPAALVATGRADAVEMLVYNPFFHHEYYRYLSAGYKLPLVGGTDKMCATVPVGMTRTYVKLLDDQPFTYDNWCAAMRAGRTFLSSGPLIDLHVEGAGIGATVNLPGNGGRVHAVASVQSIFPIHELQLVHNGAVVASTRESKGARQLHLEADIPVERHGWLAARCSGPDYQPLRHRDRLQRGVFAHTSPIYLAVGGPWWMFDHAAANYMLTLIDGSLQYIRHQARHHDDQSSVTHHHDHHDHLRFLEEPFHEAAAAIHRRMHEFGVPH